MSSSIYPSSVKGSRIRQLFLCASLFTTAFSLNAQETQFNGTVVKIASSNILTVESPEGQKTFVKISQNVNALPSQLLNANVRGSCSMRGDLCISSNLQVTSKQ
jgi:hypothetical protein